jgi:monoamine oxidase
MTNDTQDVIVIGAGMAGLTAARALAEAGRKVLVIEAKDRIGGRIWTQHIGDESIEMGAEFIHGRPPELWALIDEAGIETYERDGAQVCFEDESLNGCGGEIDEMFDPLEKLESFTGPDLTFAEYINGLQMPPEARASSIGYVEGFNAADHYQISVISLGVQQKAEEAIESIRSYHLRGGYDQLPAYLAQRLEENGGRVLLSSPVKEIRWQRDRVQVVTNSGEFTAAQGVFTLPLAVLQNGNVTISPRPDAILQAAEQLRMGQARRFTLLFRERFWERLQPQAALKELSFLFSFSEMPPVWWTPHPEKSNTLTGWVGGPRSRALAKLDPKQLGQEACATLAKIFDVNVAEIRGLLQGCYSYDWCQDQYTLGAYSYVAAGGLDASRQMGKPIENTLFFAGEHTDVTGHWGTVHAAMRSGLRAAEQALKTN